MVIRQADEPQGRPAIQTFFRNLPEEDRQYLRDDVTEDGWLRAS